MKVVSKSKILGVIGAIIVVILLFAVPTSYEDVKNEQIVVNQQLYTGKMEYWTTPGVKARWWGSVTRYYKTKQLWFSDQEGEGSEDYNDLAIPVIFNDAGNGKISGSLRVKLPLSVEYLSRIQTDYNGMERLMNDLVRPTVVKVVYASGPLMSSFESYAEKKNDLIYYITDQLNNGVYKTSVKEVEVEDALSGEMKVMKIAGLVPDSLSPGGYARQERSPFAYYGLEIGQLSISKIDYDERILAQIKTQQESNMAVQTAKVQSIEAKQQAIRAEEEGKAKATTAKWEQETIKAVEVTKAQQAFEVAALQAKEADEKAKKILAEGRAEAEAAKLKVAAGLTPYEKATIDKEKAIGIATALANYKGNWVPTVMSGSGGSNESQAMQAVGLNQMLEVIDKIGATK